MKRSKICSLRFVFCFVIGILFILSVVEGLGFTPSAFAAHKWEMGQDPGAGTTARFIIKDALGVGAIRLSISDTGTLEVGPVGSGRLVVTPTGKVGIGTANPTQKLTVVGTIDATDILKGGFPLTGGQWTTSGSNIYYNTGNVGIGTTSPTAKLSVNINEPNTNTVPYIDMNNDASGYVDWSLRKTGTNDLTMYNAYSNTPVMTWQYVAGGGCVGIGTTAPPAGALLAVSSNGGGGSAPIFQVLGYNGAPAYNNLIVRTNGTLLSLDHYGSANQQAALRINHAGPGYAAVIQGNVCIGFEPVEYPTAPLPYMLQVNGSFAAQYKNFEIPYPLDPKNKSLVHSSLEGPEHAVYYRGEDQLIDSKKEIILPDYFEALTRKESRTVQLTCVGGYSPLYVDGAVENGRFIVRTASEGNPSQKFYWEAKAVRADIPPLIPVRENNEK